MMKDDDFNMGISFLILIVISFVVGLWWLIDTIKEDKIVSPKPIIPELQITGNGTKMDTVYIYKLEE